MPPWRVRTCHPSSLRSLLNFLLVIPPELREAIHLHIGVPDGVADLPEAGEVVPVWDFAIEHGRLGWESERGVNEHRPPTLPSAAKRTKPVALSVKRGWTCHMAVEFYTWTNNQHPRHTPQDPPLWLRKLLLLLLSEPVLSGHRTPMGTVLFLNWVLPMYLLATRHHVPVTCFTSEIVKCTPDACPESPPRSVWPGVRPRGVSGSASAV